MGYVFVVLVIASWTGLAFSYRWADRSGANRILMSPVIGVTAVVLAGITALALRMDLAEADTSQFVTGGCVGVMFAVLIPVFLAAISRGDLSITWMVLSLSFALNSVAIMIYPGETPTAMGIAGLCLAAGAVVLLGFDMWARHRADHPSKSRHGWGCLMARSVIMNAATQYGYKLAQSAQIEKSMVNNVGYMLSMYSAVALTGLVMLFLLPRRKGSVGRACLTGASVGTCLFFGGIFVLQALSVGHIPGHLLFPATSGGGSILVAVLSVIFLKERPGRFGWAGIVVGAGALTLLGMAA